MTIKNAFQRHSGDLYKSQKQKFSYGFFDEPAGDAPNCRGSCDGYTTFAAPGGGGGGGKNIGIPKSPPLSAPDNPKNWRAPMPGTGKGAAIDGASGAAPLSGRLSVFGPCCAGLPHWTRTDAPLMLRPPAVRSMASSAESRVAKVTKAHLREETSTTPVISP